RVKPQQANGRVLHDLGLRPDRHRENAWDLDADIFGRQGVFEGNPDLDRLEVEISKILDDRDNEGRAAVNAHGGGPRADLPELDQDPVAGTALVALRKHDAQTDDEQTGDKGRHAEVT